jgi:hypothetical protein
VGVSIPVEFGSRPDANTIRDEYPEYVCPVDDDRRERTVHLVSDTPDPVLDRIEAEAAEGRAARDDTTGQATLTDAERERIDFTAERANVPWAQSIKALADKHGVSDWTAYVDGTLSVSEHQQVMREAGREGGGARDDGDQRDAEREASAAATEQEEGCSHARGKCENGAAGACEYLREVCGYSQSEVSEFLADDDGAELTDAEKGALSRSWKGYKFALSDFGKRLEELREEWQDAQAAARAIDGIRSDVGQEPLHFTALEGAQADLLDFLRLVANDCHECHADHEGHEHAVTSGDRESVTEAVHDGAASTPVGVSDDADRLRPNADLAASEMRRPEDTGQDTDPEGPAAPADTTPDHDPAGYPDTPKSVYYRGTPVSPHDVGRTVRDDRNATRPMDDDRDQRRHRERLSALAESDDDRDTTARVEGEQFAAERQGILGVGVDAEDTAEDKQVTLTGDDEGASSAALPSAWKGSGDDYAAGPLRVSTEGMGGYGSDTYGVILRDIDGESFEVATGIREIDRAKRIADEFTDRIGPDEVSFHSDDGATQTAAAEAKRAASETSGGLAEFQSADEPDAPDQVGEFDKSEPEQFLVRYDYGDGTGTFATKEDVGSWVVVTDGAAARRLNWYRDKDDAIEAAAGFLNGKRAIDVRNAARKTGNDDFTQNTLRRATDNQVKGSPAEALADIYDGISEVREASRDELGTIDGVGPTTLDALEAKL